MIWFWTNVSDVHMCAEVLVSCFSEQFLSVPLDGDIVQDMRNKLQSFSSVLFTVRISWYLG